jgi:hypothetical protein
MVAIILRVTIATLQRRADAGMRWSELSADQAVGAPPAAWMKYGKPQPSIFGRHLMAVLIGVTKIETCDEVFGIAHKTPIPGIRSLSQWSAQARLGPI